MPEKAFDVLQSRGYVEWCNAEDRLREVMDEGMITAYVGFDPTADSLHVGHLIPLMALAWLQRAGHRPIALAGGGTGLIGDPSGKSRERNLITVEEVRRNVEGVRPQLAHFLDFDCGANSALLLNNYDWLSSHSFLEVLRDVGKYFSVNSLIAREYVRSRLEDPDKGISYTEFSYVLLQAMDFRHLYEAHGCRLQMGGNDQQGNLLAGSDYVRKSMGGEVFGLTQPLLLTASGTKFGKTEAGAVWLDPRRTSPYRFYQFWFNTDDRDVERLLKLFTFLPLDEIRDLMERHAARPEERAAQRRLALEVTQLVHGEGAALSVVKASSVLFDAESDLTDLTEETYAALSGRGSLCRGEPGPARGLAGRAHGLRGLREPGRGQKGDPTGRCIPERDAGLRRGGGRVPGGARKGPLPFCPDRAQAVPPGRLLVDSGA